MRALFSTATSTIAWLGEMGSNSKLAYSAVSAPQRSIESVNDSRLLALADLLNRPYWSRVWIIQEFLLPLHLHVWWSSYRSTTQALRSVVWTMAQLSSRCKPEYPNIWKTPGRILLQYRDDYQRMRYSEDVTTALPSAMGLQALLRSFSTSKCSLIHDRVYALLGIASDMVDSKYPILPNYDKSLEELFLDVLRNQLRTPRRIEDIRGFLRILCTLFELDTEELVSFSPHTAPTTTRQISTLMREARAKSPLSWNGTVVWREKLNFNHSSVENPSIRSMRKVEGCIAAMEEYLDSYPIVLPYIPSSGERIRGHIVSLTDAIVAFATLNTYSGFNTRVPDGRRQRRLEQCAFYCPRSPSNFGIGIIGFTHQSVRNYEGGHLICASSRSFGQFSTALMLKCEIGCDGFHTDGSERFHKWRIVGIAFICKADSAGS